jgi:hypothetical protein
MPNTVSFSRAGLILGVAVLGGVECAQAQLFSTLESQTGSHFRVGVSVRSIGIRHSFNAPAPLRLNRFFATPSGPGDVGLITATSGPVQYQDGSLEMGFHPGVAAGVIDDRSQVADTNRNSSGFVGSIDRVTFSSSETNYSDTMTDLSVGGATSSDEAAAMPFLEWVVPLIEEDDRFLRFVTGYSFLSTGSDSGSRVVGRQTFDATTTTYQYHYDLLGGVDPGETFPLETYGILFDEALATFPGSDIGGDLLDPSVSQLQSQASTPLVAVSRSQIDVDLHEIPLGLEWGRRTGRVEWALRGGLTLNAVDLDLTTRTDWYLRGVGRPLLSSVSNESASEFACGAFLGASVTYPLNEDGSVYLRAHGTYHWVGDVSVSTPLASATVELSSWEGGVGIGMIFE